MTLKARERVMRAAGLKAAMPPEQRREKALIKAHEAMERARGERHGTELGICCTSFKSR